MQCTKLQQCEVLTHVCICDNADSHKIVVFMKGTKQVSIAALVLMLAHALYGQSWCKLYLSDDVIPDCQCHLSLHVQFPQVHLLQVRMQMEGYA